ncbi:MAG TPA: choice-of-anchor P family protein [Terriglobia bacterium]
MERRFLYHALASGVSGKITSPFQDLIEVQGASALPSTGGYSASRVESFRYKQILSLGAVTTLTVGSFSEQKRTYDTLVTATIEQLNILNVVTADRIVTRLASAQPEEGGPPRVSILGSLIENLNIAGYPLDIRPDPRPFEKYERPRRVELRSLVDPPDLDESCGFRVDEDGAFEVPQFGRLYLAEFLSTACYQSLTMLRVELGCPVATGGGHPASLSIGHGSSNGEFFPP